MPIFPESFPPLWKNSREQTFSAVFDDYSADASSRRVTAMDSSSSCASSTKSGQLVMGSEAFWTLGKASTSRRLSQPSSCMTIRSRPRAIPPWGGAPYWKASIR